MFPHGSGAEAVCNRSKLVHRLLLQAKHGTLHSLLFEFTIAMQYNISAIGHHADQDCHFHQSSLDALLIHDCRH